jgi:hypothetical protein
MSRNTCDYPLMNLVLRLRDIADTELLPLRSVIESSPSNSPYSVRGEPSPQSVLYTNEDDF